MGELVYGSELSKELRAEMKLTVDQYRQKGMRIPCLAVILVGDNPASLSYVRGKEKAVASIGMESRFFHLPEDASQEDVEKVIAQCNEDDTIDAVLLQLPLPAGLDETHALNTIDPDKDADGLHVINVGRLYSGQKGFVPCTPAGIMELLKKMNCSISGKRAVVIGRSRLVGAPVARLLQDAGATVTVCHSKTQNLRDICKEADILVAAIGRPNFIDSSYVKEGAYVIDVGINRMDNGKLVGDVLTEDVLPHVTAITPVPKGVGPMTICMLVRNTLYAYEERQS